MNLPTNDCQASLHTRYTVRLPTNQPTTRVTHQGVAQQMHAPVAGGGVGGLDQGFQLREVALGFEDVGAVAPVVGGGEEVDAWLDWVGLFCLGGCQSIHLGRQHERVTSFTSHTTAHIARTYQGCTPARSS